MTICCMLVMGVSGNRFSYDPIWLTRKPALLYSSAIWLGFSRQPSRETKYNEASHTIVCRMNAILPICLLIEIV